MRRWWGQEVVAAVLVGPGSGGCGAGGAGKWWLRCWWGREVVAAALVGPGSGGCGAGEVGPESGCCGTYVIGNTLIKLGEAEPLSQAPSKM